MRAGNGSPIEILFLYSLFATPYSLLPTAHFP
jgi:hypothetical protein